MRSLYEGCVIEPKQKAQGLMHRRMALLDRPRPAFKGAIGHQAQGARNPAGLLFFRRGLGQALPS